ncbi:type 4a pilus biogenesis protein PilO [Patescibacteria group bacterium]|nr:type 4a pilus biogenesis protein PilO [Patescibacteria group bacterium]
MNSRTLSIVAVIVALGIFFGYINPTLSGSIADTKTKIASDDKALAAASSFAAQVKRLTDAQNTIGSANLARLMLLLPDSVNNIGLILDLNALAAKSSISVSAIDVSPIAQASATVPGTGPGIQSPEQSMDFSLTLVGTYSAFKTFLAGIEKSQRLLDVQDLSIQGSDTGVYTYKLKIRLYWLR